MKKASASHLSAPFNSLILLGKTKLPNSTLYKPRFINTMNQTTPIRQSKGNDNL